MQNSPMQASSMAKYPRAIKVLLFTALALVSSITVAQDRVSQLAELSGIKAVLDELPEQTAATFVQEFEKSSNLNLGPDFEAMIHGILTENNGLTDVHSALSASLSRRQVTQLLKWYESGIGQEITALEVAANKPEQVERMMAQMNSLLGDTSKMQRARRLDQLQGITDKTLHVMEVTQLALVGSILAGNQVPEEVRASILADVKEKILGSRAEIEQFTLAMTAYTYRTLPDKQYDDYLSFLELPASEQFNEVAVDAMNGSFNRAFSALGRHIQQRISSLKVSAPTPEHTNL